MNQTCESSEMELDATVEVADEWPTVEALDTAAVAVHEQHTRAHTDRCAYTDIHPHENAWLFAVSAHASGNCVVS